MNKELCALLQEMPIGVQEASMQGFPLLLVKQRWGELAISRQGAQVLHYRPAGAAPVLWLSDCLKPPPGALRGGIPLCWPWFAAHPSNASQPFHGVARTALWDISIARNTDTSLSLDVRPCDTLLEGVEVSVEVNADATALQVLLHTHNGTGAPLELTEALHSYLAVSDVSKVTLEGLQGCSYRDKLRQNAEYQQHGILAMTESTDRIYFHDSVTLLNDTGLNRCLGIAKSGSGSTVVWNPGAAAKDIVDIGLAQQPGFVCVEAANTFLNNVQLQPGQHHSMGTTLSIME